MSAPHQDRAHAKLSPSAAHRWIECPGSIAACEGIPNKSSSFADEGTAAHQLCERCLDARCDADAYLGDAIPVNGVEYLVDDEMAEAVQIYLDFVRELYEGAEVEVEAKLDLSHIPGMAFGTGDFCAYEPLREGWKVEWGFAEPIKYEGGGVLTIVDFKYGKGVPVEVKDNPQLLTYAIGVARRYHNRGIKKVRCAVIQPRCPHKDGPVRVHEYDAVDLLDFEADLTAAALATAEPDAPRRAGEWCKFCPAAPGCAAFAGAALEVAQDVFTSPDDGVERAVLAEVHMMDADQLANALRRVYVLKAWLKRMEEYAHAEAMAGRLPTGFKLVPKRATRHWKDEAEIDVFLLSLGVDPYEQKTISPAQADKLLKKRKGLIEPYVDRISNGTNLVPLEDSREPARPEVEHVFEAT